MNHHRRLLVFLLFIFLLFSTFQLFSPPPPDKIRLTVVLPLLSIAHIDHLLEPLLGPSIHELVIVCPQSLASVTHRKLRIVLANATHGHPKVSLYPWSDRVHHHQASLATIARLNSDWVLLLDEYALTRVPECVRAYLLHPPSVPMAVGPRGFSGSSPLTLSHRVQPATYLVPPFVVPSRLLVSAPLAPSPALIWPTLGAHIAKTALGPFGGIVLGTEILDCNVSTSLNTSIDDGLVVLAFPFKTDLINFIPATCKLFHQGHTVLAYLYGPSDDTELTGLLIEKDCTIPYVLRSEKDPNLSDWLHSLASVPDIIISLDQQDSVSSAFSLILEQRPFLNTTLMRLPRRELPYTEWIGTLTLHELRHWNVPEITLSVITNNRPHSLRRLLESTRRTLFYGDKVDIRINMDQTSDPDTMRIVHDFKWPYGNVFVHHRVIHGGLLSAVVESWYPHSNDSYGLLLEDDIELSPLSYAWVKMALLRYKHGKHQASSSKLFGISLYQQKITELHPAGRRSFNAQSLFRSASLTDPSTPYLSQIPCSWGALYFPSPWREFHDYLSLRLSQSAVAIQTPIVPRVRSNRWTRSWKKYFIELVYLRGYVMLYPNYDDFLSFSTNHLEVGSHVKEEPGEVYERKKHAFAVPLMPLEGALATATATEAGRPGLLGLPGGSLPEWDKLPVLDLLGEVSSMEAIERRGYERRTELDACTGDSLPSSVRDLLCPP